MNSIIRMKDLIDWLNYYTEKYDTGEPVISDKDWDTMYFELEQLEKTTGIVFPNSPTQKIHYEVVTKLNKITHNHPMLSLDKTKEISVLKSFIKGHKWLGMFKMDGLTISLTYVDGNLSHAETRGDGVIGEDVTHNVLNIRNIPKTIPYKDLLVVDGEIICTYKDFKPFANEYKNPRNFASGSIRLLDSSESKSRNLTFIAWDLVVGYKSIDSFVERLRKLYELGFDTVPRISNVETDVETIEDAIEILDNFKNNDIEFKEYPIDGYVFKFDSVSYGQELGRTEHHFKNAIAYKFYDEEYESELLDIEWSMGRTGILTPVAIFKPIEIEGTIVERASLHNLSIMKETLGRYPELYQKIWVIKSNQIIPQIINSIKNNIQHDHIIYDYHTSILCPICGEPTEIVISDSGVESMVCKNPNCSGKLINIIDHYLGKKGLDVKGISKMTIEKLINWGWLNGLTDIYKLNEHKSEWVSKAGFGEASVGKILHAIDASKNGVQLESYISALGIPLVGRTVAKEIVKYYDTWEDFRAAVGGDWTEFNGFGYEISRSINNFDYTIADKIAGMLDFEQPVGQVSADETSKILEGKTFCITGKIEHFKNREQFKAYIESFGGKVTNSVTSKTNYLINNNIDSTSSKNKKAKELNIPIITEDEFRMDLIEKLNNDVLIPAI